MTRTSIASFAIGALAVGLVAAGTAYAVIGPDDTRVVAPVSVNRADAGTSLEPGTDPGTGTGTGTGAAPSTAPSRSSSPSSSPSRDDSDDSGDDDSGSGKGSDNRSGSAVAVPEGITVDRARVIALGVKAGTVRETKLDDEDGRTVWDVELTGTDGTPWEITIDAVSGAVVKTERD